MNVPEQQMGLSRNSWTVNLVHERPKSKIIYEPDSSSIFMSVHLMCSWTVHECFWATNDTFMNEQELRLFNNEPAKPATLNLSSCCSQTKFVVMFMNVHELLMKMHYLSNHLTCKIYTVLRSGIIAGEVGDCTSIGKKSRRQGTRAGLLNHIETAVWATSHQSKGKDWPFWDVLCFLSSVLKPPSWTVIVSQPSVSAVPSPKLAM